MHVHVCMRRHMLACRHWQVTEAPHARAGSVIVLETPPSSRLLQASMATPMLLVLLPPHGTGTGQRTCMHVCMRARMHVRMYGIRCSSSSSLPTAQVQVRGHVCMCACVHVCMCACMASDAPRPPPSPRHRPEPLASDGIRWHQMASDGTHAYMPTCMHTYVRTCMHTYRSEPLA